MQRKESDYAQTNTSNPRGHTHTNHTKDKKGGLQQYTIHTEEKEGYKGNQATTTRKDGWREVSV